LKVLEGEGVFELTFIPLLPSHNRRGEFEEEMIYHAFV